MDKRWKNFGIIIGIVLIFIFVCAIFTQNIFGSQEVVDETILQDELSDSEEIAYLSLANLFGLNNFDLNVFSNNNLILFDSNKISLVYSKDDLLSFDSQLDYLLDSQQIDLTKDEFEQFEGMIIIYKMQIDFTLNYFDLLTNFSKRYSKLAEFNEYSDLNFYCETNFEIDSNLLDEAFLVTQKLDLLSDNINNYFAQYDLILLPYADFDSVYDEIYFIAEIIDWELFSVCG